MPDSMARLLSSTAPRFGRLSSASPAGRNVAALTSASHRRIVLPDWRRPADVVRRIIWPMLHAHHDVRDADRVPNGARPIADPAARNLACLARTRSLLSLDSAYAISSATLSEIRPPMMVRSFRCGCVTNSTRPPAATTSRSIWMVSSFRSSRSCFHTTRTRIRPWRKPSSTPTHVRSNLALRLCADPPRTCTSAARRNGGHPPMPRVWAIRPADLPVMSGRGHSSLRREIRPDRRQCARSPYLARRSASRCRSTKPRGRPSSGPV
jgi:hypothetical protein